MSFFERPIITGHWHIPAADNFVFKAFKKNDKEVEIRIYREGALRDIEIESSSFVMSYNCFYNNFVRILNMSKSFINDAGKEIYGTWTCLPKDKVKVLASMPATSEMAENAMEIEMPIDVQGESSTTIPKTNRMRFAKGAIISGQQPGDVFGGKSRRRGKRSNKRSNKRSKKTRHRRSRR
jgi:hypothetical protein